MKSFSRVTAVSVLVVGIDALSKFWAEGALDLYSPIPAIGQFLRLTLGYNTGVAFGLFANGGPWTAILSGVIIFGMVIWLLQLLRSGEFPTQTVWPIGLFLGGAIANFVDRLPDGRVTDFLDVGFGAARWPTFNLADSFIVLGATILLLMTLLEQRQLKEKA
jgi:signal peptidase II